MCKYAIRCQFSLEILALAYPLRRVTSWLFSSTVVAALLAVLTLSLGAAAATLLCALGQHCHCRHCQWLLFFFWGRPWWQWHPRRCLRCLALRHLLLWNNGTFWLHWLHWLHHWLISTGTGCRCILRRNQYGTALAQNPQPYSCVILTHEKTGNEKPSN